MEEGIPKLRIAQEQRRVLGLKLIRPQATQLRITDAARFVVKAGTYSGGFEIEEVETVFALRPPIVVPSKHDGFEYDVIANFEGLVWFRTLSPLVQSRVSRINCLRIEGSTMPRENWPAIGTWFLEYLFGKVSTRTERAARKAVRHSRFRKLEPLAKLEVALEPLTRDTRDD